MFDEPEIQPDDTRPTQTFPAVTIDPESGEVVQRRETPRWQSVVGLVSLVAALALTVGAVALLVMQPGGGDASPTVAEDLAPTDAPQIEAVDAELQPTSVPDADAAPTEVAAAEEGAPPGNVFLLNREAIPTASGDLLQSLLLTPVAQVEDSDPLQISRSPLDPFTIIPQRPRNTIIEHTIVRGDTISDLARFYGISQESIAWSNDRRKIWTLIPGDTLYIPPVDGVYHQAVGDSTIGELTTYYSIEDPYTVIDSPFNPQLRGFTPDTVPPSGMRIFFPGGIGEGIDWTPPALQTTSGGGSGTGPNAAGLISFEPGAPGSCAPQPPGAGSAWNPPMVPGTYTITRTFSSWHQGIDLAANPGTPIRAANSGRVIFAGWSNWGYGRAVVISHGSFTTLYGHMQSVYVGCGQVVSSGETIGEVGSTGNSSGPHLHFEIMSGGGVRGNPQATLGF